jgi:putative redox protein
MKTLVSTKWLDNMAFESEINGHRITIDASEDVGGQNRGPRPKPLILTALAGCTGMDVVSILKKMQVNFSNYQIHVEGEIAEEHPKLYTKIHVIHEFTGKNLPMDKLQKAVSLSEDKYCGVGATLKKALPITSEIKIIDND